MNEFITQISDKIWLVIIICSATGYFIGAISFARLINYMVTEDDKNKFVFRTCAPFR